MNTQYRQPKIDDAEDLAKLHLKVWEDTYTGLLSDEVIHGRSLESRIEQWKNTITKCDNRRFIELAVVDDRIAGFIFASTDKRDNDIEADSEIYAINILKEVQKKGIGKALLNDTFRWLRSQGCHSTYLWVLEANTNAIGFYHQVGGVSFQKRKKLDCEHIALRWELDG
ncbi:MAG: GNAT family N-acetyltransferase [Deltaproteobacteria bacterium]|nr:GNAT family N-acetyltransferase [Deltaproteobacteria bacterium]